MVLLSKSYSILLITLNAAILSIKCLQSIRLLYYKMYKSPFIFILMMIVSLRSVAQQNNIWYFGNNGGLNFNPVAGPSLPVAIGNSAMVAPEGSSSICDVNGQLLFYSNGVTVYNRNHSKMLNGDSLAGNKSSVQACLIVPVPGNDSIYYIFTSDAIENNYANGYCYSIINMRKDNGNGEVIAKNVVLHSSCTERLIAARHANAVDVWVITNDNSSNIFRAWLITCNGLQPDPVVSTTGVVFNQDFINNTGMMKVSPDGKQLCQAHFPEFDGGPNFVQLFDFNNATGVLSNPRSIGFPNAQILACEFSPDSKLIYLARPGDRAIDQVEATLPTVANIIASRINISTGIAGFLGIQLAPDEKIYLSQPSQYLGAINYPNTKGTGCNIQLNQIQLVNGSAYLGLPAYINDLSFDPNNSFSYNVLDSCAGIVQFQGLSTMTGTLQWSWDFGDGTVSNIRNPVHTFTPSNQIYTVKIKTSSSLICGAVERSRFVKPGGIIADADFDFINKCDSGYIRFVNKSSLIHDPSIRFSWEFGDGSFSNLPEPIHTYNTSGIYNVKLKLKTNNGCLDDSITHQLDITRVTLNLPPAQTILIGNSVQLNVTGGGNNVVWAPPSGLSNPNIKNPVAMPLNDITYKVTVTNSEGCISEDSVFIKVIQLDNFYMPTAFTPNNDGKNDLIRPFYGSKFFLKEFSIYNRWGQKVFSTSVKGAGWNGKVNNILQNPGAYVWFINASDINGALIERKGSFVLIR